jgi:hypothetical protein
VDTSAFSMIFIQLYLTAVGSLAQNISMILFFDSAEVDYIYMNLFDFLILLFAQHNREYT